MSQTLLESSRRSLRKGRPQTIQIKNNRPKFLYFSLCPRDQTDAELYGHTTASLGHFLAVERKAEHKRRYSSMIYGLKDIALAQESREQNPHFVDGHVKCGSAASVKSMSLFRRKKRRKGVLDHRNVCGVPLVFHCILCVANTFTS